MDGNTLRIPVELETKSFEREIEQTEKKLQELLQSADESNIPKQFRRSAEESRKLQEEIEKTSNKLIDLRKKQQDIDDVKNNNFKKMLNETNETIGKNIKSLGKMALGIFSIRSAYMFVRGAVSTLSSENEQLGADIENIRYGLASALLPVIQTIVSWVQTLMSYVNAITQAWWGFSVFSSKSSKNMASTSKSAKELKKSLAGFDEMNTLSSSSSSSGSASSGGASYKDFQLEGPVPEWLKWIMDNKDAVLGFLTQALSLIVLVKGLMIAKEFWDWGDALRSVLGTMTLIKTLGIGALFTAIAFLIQDIVRIIQDPSWQNFVSILSDIAIGIGAIMLITGNWWGLLVVILGLLVRTIVQNWDTIKSVFSSVASWFNNNVIKPVGGFFSGLWNGIISGAQRGWQGITKAFSNIGSFFSRIFSSLNNTFSKFGSKVGNIVGSAFKRVINAVLGTIDTIINTPIRTINSLIDTINSVPGVNIGRINTIRIPRLAKGGIINLPGRGVPLGSAIGGEHGREGVLPLDDTQQMETLGKAIGRHVTINLTSINRLDSREISRKTEQVTNSRNFAMNRG